MELRAFQCSKGHIHWGTFPLLAIVSHVLLGFTVPNEMWALFVISYTLSSFLPGWGGGTGEKTRRNRRECGEILRITPQSPFVGLDIFARREI